jgi:hypothetical protein
MANTPTYSILFTPGQREVRLTLIESVRDTHHQVIPRELLSVWTAWEGSLNAARRLVSEALQRASDTLPPMLPLENDTPKASAPPGGPRGVLSDPSATLKNVHRRR